MNHKRKAFVAAVSLLASLATVPSTHAQVGAQAGVPGGPYATAFRVQNLDSVNTAKCSYQMFNDNGSAAYSSPEFTIAGGSSAYVYTPDLGASLPSGTFSGVVSCDRDVAAVVNFSDPNKGDAYVGTTDPSPTLYTPSAYDNYYGYYTSLRIMDASGTAQTAKVEFYAPGSTAPVATRDVPLAANGAATVDQGGMAELQQDISYSAKITGAGDLAATVTIFGGTGTPVANQLYAFSGFAGGSTSTIYTPVIMRDFYGYNTATTIQNVGGGAARVRVTYSNGTQREFDIAANSSVVVANFQETTLQQNVLYSAKIDNVGASAQPLIVTVNESTPTTNRATTYEGMSAGAKNLVAPVVMKGFYGYNSSVTCQNIETSGTTRVGITYKGKDLAGNDVNLTGISKDIPAGQTNILYQPDEALPAGFLGSAVITSTTGNIVCVANQDQNMAPEVSRNADLLGAYDLILKPAQ